MPSAYGFSIHRPARGATVVIGIPNWLAKFQSTPPRGATRDRGGDGHLVCRFQSTPPRGGDSDREGCIAPDHGFNHRPARGATYGGAVIQIIVFQSTPRAGGDHVAWEMNTIILVQSTPRAGGDVHGYEAIR